MFRMNLYRHERISPSTTRIYDCVGGVMYLVEGANEAALIDTGAGVGNLSSYVKAITPLPVRVLLTHGHCDHIGGANGFETVHLHPNDTALACEHRALDLRWKNAEQMARMTGASFSRKDLMPASGDLFAPLSDGEVFHLGGIELEIIALPGHTAGSVCVLHRQERYMITGDACNPVVFLFLPESSTVASYYENLQRFSHQRFRYDVVYVSHRSGNVVNSIAADISLVCRDVLDGNSDAVPFAFQDQTALAAKSFFPDMRRIDGGVGNIVYLPQKVTKGD